MNYLKNRVDKILVLFIKTIDTLSKSFFSIPHFNSGMDHFILLK